MKRKMESHDDWYCLLDLNYSSHLLSTKIADIPQKLKYETIIAPIFEYCFGTSDQEKVWETSVETLHFIYDEHDFELSLLYFRTDWTRDETFIFSQIFNLYDSNFITCARKFGFFYNRQFILNAIRYFRGHVIFPYCDPLLTSDFEIMMAAVKEHGGSLQCASDELRNNREFVKQAVKQDGDVLYLASKEWKDDKEIVMLALESSPRTAYACASLRLRKDRDVVFKAVSHGCKISYIDKSFNNDRELLLMSSKIIGFETLQFACSELKKEKEIVFQAIQQDPLAFYCASNELKNDREFVKEIVKKNGQCLGFASEELQDDKEIIELALKSCPDAIYSISERLRKDTEFISNIIGKRGFKSLPKEFSNNREIVLGSIELDPRNLTRASMELRNDREFILQVVKNCGMAYEFVNVKLKSDLEIIMEAITQNGDAIEFIPFEYFNNEEIIIKATQTATNIHLYEKLSDRLKNDREFLLKCKCSLFFDSFPRKYQTDREIVMKCLRPNLAGSLVFFSSFPRKYQMDREIVMEAVETNPDLVLKYSYPLVVSDRVLAMRIVKRNGLLLRELPFKYRNDREIVSFAIQQNKEAFKFVSDELHNEFNWKH